MANRRGQINKVKKRQANGC